MQFSSKKYFQLVKICLIFTDAGCHNKSPQRSATITPLCYTGYTRPGVYKRRPMTYELPAGDLMSSELRDCINVLIHNVAPSSLSRFTLFLISSLCIFHHLLCLRTPVPKVYLLLFHKQHVFTRGSQLLFLQDEDVCSLSAFSENTLPISRFKVDTLLHLYLK
jgi:hypothetical protein